MTKNLLLIVLTISISFNSFSQKNIDPDDQDKLAANSLKIKYPDDNIALENSKDYISFNFNNRTNRVNVNHSSEENLINLDSRANIQKYCFYDGESEITKFDIKYKNNKSTKFYVQDDAYTSNDLFHNDTRVKYVHLDFPLKGYKYSTTIEKKYFDIKYFTKIYFNDEYPIAKKNIQIEVPKWLNVELKEMNFEGYEIKKEVVSNEDSDFSIYNYLLENVTAIDKEKNSPGPTHMYPHILILPKSYERNGKKVTLFNSTKDLYIWYKSLADSLKNDDKPFIYKVEELTKNAKTDDEKIKNIFYWVQDNIRYIAFEDGLAGFKPDAAANVYNKKYGDCKGMANLTKQMLIEAGFDARLTWLGTKRIAYDYSTPNLSVDNHMICSLLKDGKTIFLDATEKFNSYGEYADRIQGKQVLIESGDDFVLETVPTSKADFNKESIKYNLILNNGVLEGTAKKKYNGESRTKALYYFNTLKNDRKEEFLEWYLNKGDSNIKVSNIETSDLLNRDLDLDISYAISIKNAVSEFDENVYINIDFDKELSDLSLKERKTSYIFDFKKSLESITTLQIPSGYKISSFPESISVINNNYELAVNFSQNGNTIIYKKHFVIKNAKVDPSDFEEWNNFISNLNSLYNEQIILIKQQ